MKPIYSVLVIEDNDDDFELIFDAFSHKESMDIIINRATNGKQALEYLYNVGEYDNNILYPKPSLILLDLNMIGIDGYRLLKMIRSHSALKVIPIVVLTMSEKSEDIDQCYLLGANSFLRKPKDIERFKTVVSMARDYWFSISLLPKS